MLKKISIALLSVLIISCGGKSDPIKVDSYNIKSNEDEIININLFNYINTQMKNLTLNSEFDELDVNFDKNKNILEIKPKDDINGEFNLELSGEDSNGKNRIFNFNLNIQAINDIPRLTIENLKLSYNSINIINTNSTLYDIESDINSINYEIVENDSDMELIIENNLLLIKPKNLTSHKIANYKIKFIDNNEIQYKNINIEFTYINGNIPLTEDSSLNITIEEDTQYIGKIEPIINYNGQNFIINYDLSNLKGKIVKIDDFNYEYTPPINFNGQDSFIVNIKNNDGDDVNFPILINIVSKIDNFIILNINKTINEDSDLILNLPIIDPENYSDFTYIFNQDLVNGLLIIENGILNYKPNKDFFGIIDLDITAIDNLNNRSYTFNFYVNVISSLDPLAIEDQTLYLMRGYNYSDKFTFYDGENNSSKYYFSITQPKEGNVTINNLDGTFTYVSKIDGIEKIESFVIKVLDSNNSRFDEVVITVNIIDSSYEQINLTAYEDVDLEQIKIPAIIEGYELDFNVSIINQPSHGNININSNKTLNYKTNLNYYGDDEFTIRVTDKNTGYFVDFNYFITIINVPDNVDLSKINYNLSLLEDAYLEYNLNVIDNDNNNAINYEIYKSPNNGNLILENGVFRYTPNLNFNGEDSIQIKIIKNDIGYSEILNFNLHIIPQEDPLVISENIILNMYSNSYKELNLRNMITNYDNEDFIFIGDKYNELSNEWIINSNGLNITINQDTGVIKILTSNLLNKNDKKTFYFKVKEINTGTVWFFPIEINIIDNLIIVNPSTDIETLLSGYIGDYKFLFCPGDYNLSSNGLNLQNGIKIYGSSNDLENESNVDIYYHCINDSGETNLMLSGSSIYLNIDNELNGFNIILKDAVSAITKSPNVNTINSALIKNNTFKTEIDSDVFFIDTNNGYLFKSTIEKNKFYGLNEDVFNLNKGINIDNAYQINNFKNNYFYNLSKGVNIGTILRKGSDATSLEMNIDGNIFYKVKNAIEVLKLDRLNTNTNYINVNNNNINKSDYAIMIYNAGLQGSYGSKLYLNIDNNKLENIKYRGIVLNNGNIKTGTYNSHINITNNGIIISDGTGIEIFDTMILNEYLLIYGQSINISNNSIHPNKNSLFEDHIGISYIIDYYDSESLTKDITEEKTLTSLKNNTVDIKNNLIGNKLSPYTFGKAGLLFSRVNNEFNIINSNIFKIVFNIEENNIYAKNDIFIDHNKINKNSESLSLNLIKNITNTKFPNASFSIKENYTNGCLFFSENQFDYVELENEDIENSNIIIADPNDVGINIFFNEQESLGNVILDGYNFQIKEKCI